MRGVRTIRLLFEQRLPSTERFIVSSEPVERRGASEHGLVGQLAATVSQIRIEADERARSIPAIEQHARDRYTRHLRLFALRILRDELRVESDRALVVAATARIALLVEDRLRGLCTRALRHDD